MRNDHGVDRVTAHEVPQDVGHFGIPLDSGCSRTKALRIDVLSSVPPHCPSWLLPASPALRDECPLMHGNNCCVTPVPNADITTLEGLSCTHSRISSPPTSAS